jgi:hypothetical protein
MKKEPNMQANEIDIRAIRHALSSALADFRLANEILLGKDPDRVEAKTAFDTGEKKLEKALELLAATKSGA